MTSKNLLIKILSYLADFYFYHILNNVNQEHMGSCVNVKVKIEQTDLVTFNHYSTITFYILFIV